MGATGYTSGDPRKLNRTGYTKGDILAANTSGALTAVPVGTNAEVLVADSSDVKGVDWTPGGAVPSDTVTPGTGYGQTATAGDAATYSRGDHTHGTPATQDLSGLVHLTPTAMQVMTPNGSAVWLRVTMPYSASDSNEDLYQARALHSNGSTAIKTFWLNGNGEPRAAPSTVNRVAQRIFEIAEAITSGGSTEDVWQVSTNPTNSANREAYWAVRGNGHATQPGWMVGTRPFQTTQATVTGALTVGGLPVTGTDLATPMVAENDTTGVNLGARLANNGRTVELGGRIVNNTVGSIAGGTTYFTLPLALRPPYQVKLNVRFTGGGNILTVDTTGEVRMGTALPAGSEAFMDGLSFPRVWL